MLRVIKFAITAELIISMQLKKKKILLNFDMRKIKNLPESMSNK